MDIDVRVVGNAADDVDVFFDRRPESGAMEQLRSEHLSLFECLAVVAALALQIASLITLLQSHAGL